MRWSYKTVHYELQKEGLLGNAFLDETELEKSLNEYGKAGWELVAILETLDGVIAVMKQPLSYDDEVYSSRPKKTTAMEKSYRAENIEAERDPIPSLRETFVRPQAAMKRSDRGNVDHPSSTAEPEKSDESADVGSIRIE